MELFIAEEARFFLSILSLVLFDVPRLYHSTNDLESSHITALGG